MEKDNSSPNKNIGILDFLSKYKYIIVTVAFSVWMLFFDQNSFLMHKELSSEISKLNEDVEYYQKELEAQNEELKQLEHDKKFVRENCSWKIFHEEKQRRYIYHWAKRQHSARRKLGYNMNFLKAILRPDVQTWLKEHAKSNPYGLALKSLLLPMFPCHSLCSKLRVNSF